MCTGPLCFAGNNTKCRMFGTDLRARCDDTASDTVCGGHCSWNSWLQTSLRPLLVIFVPRLLLQSANHPINALRDTPYMIYIKAMPGLVDAFSIIMNRCCLYTYCTHTHTPTHPPTPTHTSRTLRLPPATMIFFFSSLQKPKVKKWKENGVLILRFVFVSSSLHSIVSPHASATKNVLRCQCSTVSYWTAAGVRSDWEKITGLNCQGKITVVFHSF